MREEHAVADWDADRTCLNRHLVRDMEGLWSELFKLATVVEASLRNSVQALCDARADLAAEVRVEEREIDRREVDLERECLRILALHQPVASDLRRVAVVLKVTNNLERMGDLAVHIAKRAKKLARQSQNQEPLISPQMEFLAMESLAQVRDSLDALSKGDVELARQVIASDRQIDLRRELILKELKQSIRNAPDRLNTWLRLINTARNLERIADHATNIAEAVIYLKEGEIVRHLAPRGTAEAEVV